MEPPLGIVYRTWSGLWIVTKNGSSRLPVKNNLGIYKAKFCSTGESILVDKNGNASDKYMVQNLVTGKTVDITASPDQYFCSIDWLGNRCDTLLAYPMLSSGPSSDCISYPVLIDMNGNINIIGTSSSSPYNKAAVSPNGEYIAYSDRGHPILYKLGNGSVPLNFDQEVFPGCGYSFIYPTWSGDSSKVAWEVMGRINGSRVEGIGIYDLPGNTSTFLYPFALVDMSLVNIAWNPKHDYLLVHSRAIDRNPLSVIKPDGTTLFYLDNAVLQNSIPDDNWSPDGEWLSYSVYESIGYMQYVISSDGQVLHALSPGYFIDWSPDSRYLVYQDHNGYVLVKTGEWVPYRLHLPSGAKIMDWINQTP
jgi:Tol biopolymer transport system component